MAHRLLFSAFWPLQPEGAVLCTISLAMCLKNFNKDEFQRAGCDLKLSSAQPKSIIQLLDFSQLQHEALPQAILRPVNGKGAPATRRSFSPRPARAEGARPRDPVKLDMNRLELKFIGGEGSSMAFLFFASYAAPSPCPVLPPPI